MGDEDETPGWLRRRLPLPAAIAPPLIGAAVGAVLVVLGTTLWIAIGPEIPEAAGWPLPYVAGIVLATHWWWLALGAVVGALAGALLGGAATRR
jgi:hypothetical protein